MSASSVPGGATGRAVMIASQDVTPEQVERFETWYTHEHVPERLRVDGISGATRYRRRTADDGPGLEYLAVYEARDTGVFASAEYLAQTDNPSDLTRAVLAARVAAGTATGRAVLRIDRAHGGSVGATLVYVEFAPAVDAAFLEWYDDELVGTLFAHTAVCDVRLLAVDDGATNAKSGTADARALGDTRKAKARVLLVSATSALADAVVGELRSALGARSNAPVELTRYDFLMTRGGR